MATPTPKIPTELRDCRKMKLVVGDCIVSVENAWHGKIEAFEIHKAAPEDGGDYPMLKCKGINFWDNSIDEDDTQWYAPADVYKAPRKRYVNQPVNQLNLL